MTFTNTGSEYIDKIWLNATVPTTDPFGTDNSKNFDSGNFMMVRPQNTSKGFDVSIQGNTSTYHYINRKEYTFQGSDETPSFINAPASEITLPNGNNPSEVEVGAFRVGDQEYYYALAEDDAGGCDGSGSAQLRVGQTQHNESSMGTYDFTDDGPDQQPADYVNYTIASTDDADYGITSGAPAGETGVRLTLNSSTYREYDVLTACDEASVTGSSEDFTVRTRYNVGYDQIDDLTAGSTSGGKRVEFLFDGDESSTGSLIAPGQIFKVDVAAEVPRAVRQGDLGDGWLNFLVTSDNSQT